MAAVRENDSSLANKCLAPLATPSLSPWTLEKEQCPFPRLERRGQALPPGKGMPDAESNFWKGNPHPLLRRIKLIWRPISKLWQRIIHSNVTNVLQCSKPEMVWRSTSENHTRLPILLKSCVKLPLNWGPPSTPPPSYPPTGRRTATTVVVPSLPHISVNLERQWRLRNQHHFLNPNHLRPLHLQCVMGMEVNLCGVWWKIVTWFSWRILENWHREKNGIMNMITLLTPTIWRILNISKASSMSQKTYPSKAKTNIGASGRGSVLIKMLPRVFSLIVPANIAFICVYSLAS